MGTIYKAVSMDDGSPVALKLLEHVPPDALDRFARESWVLSQLDHPRIVRYIDHGLSDHGQPFLAMEWLDGHDLAERMANGPIGHDDVLAIVRGTAEALAVAHRRGIVHRDIKPSNLFLVGGHATQVKLLDFGVARLADDTRNMTATGTIIGTPGFMAPEQARGEKQLGPQVDIFALGCVAYAALAGAPPFDAENIVGIMFRVLFEEPVNLSRLVPSLGNSVASLIHSMLAKAAGDRPANGAALIEELARVPIVDPTEPSALALSSGEQLTTSLLLARPTMGLWSPNGPEAGQLRSVANEFAGRMERIADGSTLIVFQQRGSASEQAERAARAALAIKALIPSAGLAVASGWMESGDNGVIGPVIDQVVARAERTGAGRIIVDDATCALLGDQFDFGPPSPSRRLFGPRQLEADATIRQGPSRMLGRRRELSLLRALLEESMEDCVARAAVVIGEAGSGKSRLRQELVAECGRLPVELLLGRADPLKIDAAHALVGDVIRRTCRIVEGEEAEHAGQKLLSRIERVAPDQAHRLVAPLAEIAGIRVFDDLVTDPGADHLLRQDRRRNAWLDWISAEATAHPILLMLEDLHWADRASVDLLDQTLDHLRERPLLVIALARPSVVDRFPQVWSQRHRQEIRLSPLGAKASAQLAAGILDAPADDPRVLQVVARAGGNPLFIEELSRSQLTDAAKALPDSVLLVIQARLEHLPSDVRRTLRAASIMGERFSPDAIANMLAEDVRFIHERLDYLVRADLVERPWSDEAAKSAEMSFRHILVRDAAYASLDEHDRRSGHCLAADWLAERSPGGPALIAEHWVRGGRPDRAVVWMIRGADAALIAGDPDGALELTERAMAHATPIEAAQLHSLRTDAFLARNQLTEAIEAGRIAFDNLPPSSAAWFIAANGLFVAATRQNQVDTSRMVLEALLRSSPTDDEAREQLIATLCRACINILRYGLAEQAEPIVEHLEQRVATEGVWTPKVAALVWSVRGIVARSRADVDMCVEASRRELEAYAQMDDQRGTCYAHVSNSGLYMEIGDLETAEAQALLAFEQATNRGLGATRSICQYSLAELRARLGRPDESVALAQSVLAAAESSSYLALQGLAGRTLAAAHHALGQLDQARAVAHSICQRLTSLPPVLGPALAVYSRILRTLGDLHASRDAAQRAHALGLPDHGLDTGPDLIRQEAIEAFRRAGDHDSALHLARAGVHSLAERAARMTAAWRPGFLWRVSERRAILEAAIDIGIELPAIVSVARPA